MVSGPRLAMSAKAAFYDVDGTLVRTNIVHTYAYYAMNRGSLTFISTNKGPSRLAAAISKRIQKD